MYFPDKLTSLSRVGYDVLSGMKNKYLKIALIFIAILVTALVVMLTTSLSKSRASAYSIRASEMASYTFYRAYNMGGPEVTVDGNLWQSTTNNTSIGVTGTPRTNYWLQLNPTVDEKKQVMLQTWVHHWDTTAKIKNVPKGDYRIFLYFVQDWDDPKTKAVPIRVENEKKGSYTAGKKGSWQKVGPFDSTVSDGTLDIAIKGISNLAGIEILSTTQPVTSVQPTQAVPVAKLYRAISLNTAATTIDGNPWEGSNSPNYVTNGTRFCNNGVSLIPATDTARTGMLRCSVWAWKNTLTLKNIPSGTYTVYLNTWEDNASETFDISVNGKIVQAKYSSGPAGTWRRLGPWQASPVGGSIILEAVGGNSNFSGVELWTESGSGPIATTAPSSTSAPTVVASVTRAPMSVAPSPSVTPRTTSPTPLPTTQASKSSLRTSGNLIVYPNGKRFMARGVNLELFRDNGCSHITDRGIMNKTQIVSKMKEIGINAVRINYNATPDWLNGNDGFPSASGYEHKANYANFEDYMKLLTMNGIYVMPSDHSYTGKNLTGMETKSFPYFRKFIESARRDGYEHMLIMNPYNEPYDNETTAKYEAWQTANRATLDFLRKTMGFKGLVVLDLPAWAASSQEAFDSSVYPPKTKSNVPQMQAMIAYDAQLLGGTGNVAFSNHFYPNIGTDSPNKAIESAKTVPLVIGELGPWWHGGYDPSYNTSIIALIRDKGIPNGHNGIFPWMWNWCDGNSLTVNTMVKDDNFTINELGTTWIQEWFSKTLQSYPHTP